MRNFLSKFKNFILILKTDAIIRYQSADLSCINFLVPFLSFISRTNNRLRSLHNFTLSHGWDRCDQILWKYLKQSNNASNYCFLKNH